MVHAAVWSQVRIDVGNDFDTTLDQRVDILEPRLVWLDSMRLLFVYGRNADRATENADGAYDTQSPCRLPYGLPYALASVVQRGTEDSSCPSPRRLRRNQPASRRNAEEVILGNVRPDRGREWGSAWRPGGKTLSIEHLRQPAEWGVSIFARLK